MATLIRYLFGSGWRIAWYLAFYAAVLLFAGGTLLVFANELKPPGAKPDPASPGSMLVLMVAFTLAALTLVNASIFAAGLDVRWYVKLGIALGAAAAVAAVGFPVNSHLALAQSRGALYANVLYVALAVVLNLTMLWLAQTRVGLGAPVGSMPRA